MGKIKLSFGGLKFDFRILRLDFTDVKLSFNILRFDFILRSGGLGLGKPFFDYFNLFFLSFNV